MSAKKVVLSNVEARNVVGSSIDRNGKGWINVWEEFTGREANKCIFLGCSEYPALGGHLFIKGRSQHYCYIAPICNSCNNDKSGDYFETKSNVAFMRLESLTCFK
jgi:hypothetical protein